MCCFISVPQKIGHQGLDGSHLRKNLQMLKKANRIIKLWETRIMNKAPGTHPECPLFPYTSEMVFLEPEMHLRSENKDLEIYLQHHSPSLSMVCHPTNRARGMGLRTVQVPPPRTATPNQTHFCGRTPKGTASAHMSSSDGSNRACLCGGPTSVQTGTHVFT